MKLKQWFSTFSWPLLNCQIDTTDVVYNPTLISMLFQCALLSRLPQSIMAITFSINPDS